MIVKSVGWTYIRGQAAFFLFFVTPKEKVFFFLRQRNDLKIQPGNTANSSRLAQDTPHIQFVCNAQKLPEQRVSPDITSLRQFE